MYAKTAKKLEENLRDLNSHLPKNAKTIVSTKSKATQNRFIDGRVYTENEAIEILELHYQRHQPPLQYAIHRNVETRSMMRFHKLLKTITPDVSLFILQEP